MSYIRSHAKEMNIDPKFQEEIDLHIHVPAGAVPKDGPSAGVTMLTALASLITQTNVRHRLAMTGEITLSGQVLPVGGVKEKVIAAHRAGVTTLLLPEENRKDYFEEVPADIRAGLSTHFVKHAKDVLKLALEPKSEVEP